MINDGGKIIKIIDFWNKSVENDKLCNREILDIIIKQKIIWKLIF